MHVYEVLLVLENWTPGAIFANRGLVNVRLVCYTRGHAFLLFPVENVSSFELSQSLEKFALYRLRKRIYFVFWKVDPLAREVPNLSWTIVLWLCRYNGFQCLLNLRVLDSRERCSLRWQWFESSLIFCWASNFAFSTRIKSLCRLPAQMMIRWFRNW